jgi:hypothetical protein
MAKIEVHLRDGQRLGWVQMRDGKPYYGYSQKEATDMDYQEALDMVGRWSTSYKVTIHRKSSEIYDEGNVQTVYDL